MTVKELKDPESRRTSAAFLVCTVTVMDDDTEVMFVILAIRMVSGTPAALGVTPERVIVTTSPERLALKVPSMVGEEAKRVAL